MLYEHSLRGEHKNAPVVAVRVLVAPREWSFEIARVLDLQLLDSEAVHDQNCESGLYASDWRRGACRIIRCRRGFLCCCREFKNIYCIWVSYLSQVGVGYHFSQDKPLLTELILAKCLFCTNLTPHALRFLIVQATHARNIIHLDKNSLYRILVKSFGNPRSKLLV